jgi:DNA polymerase III epsilon subunit-like protein
MQLRAAVDIETTGLSKGQDEIIELAFLPFNEDFTIISKFVTYVKPLRGIKAAAFAVNGISFEMVENAPTPLQVRGAFLDWKENILGEGKIELLGQNVCGFDRPFLDYFFGDISNDIFSHRADDTMVLSRAMKKAGLLPNLKSTGADALCEYFNIIRGKAHRAEDDARAALQIWQKLIGILTKCK